MNYKYTAMFRKIIIFMLFVAISIPSCMAQYLGASDYKNLVGTWKYEHADTIFTIYLKTSKQVYVDGTSSTWLVGGYRLYVKGKFDNNYIKKSKVPSTLYQEKGQSFNSKSYIYLYGASKEKNTAVLSLYETRIERTNGQDAYGFRIKIRSDGTLEWKYDKSLEDFVCGINVEVPDYRTSVPKYAIMKKVN